MPDRIHRGGKYYEVKRRHDGTFKKVDPWSSKKEGCFIATAVYGTPLAIDILYLKLFRDRYLKKNFITKQFVLFYYMVSPSLAKKIEKSFFIKKLLKIFLKPLIMIFKDQYCKEDRLGD